MHRLIEPFPVLRGWWSVWPYRNDTVTKISTRDIVTLPVRQNQYDDLRTELHKLEYEIVFSLFFAVHSDSFQVCP